MPQHFKNHGYFCQNIGKLFHNMGDTQDRRSWSIDEVLHKGTHAADTVFFNSVPAKGKPHYKAPVTEFHDVPDIAYRDGQIANLAAAMLRDYPSEGKPFFLAVGFWRPHLPFVAPKKYWDLHAPSEIPLPHPAQPPTSVPTIAMHASREIKGYGLTPRDRPFSETETRHYRHGYYASISFLDAQVGEILEALHESPHAENTIVVFTSDHGFHIGEHSLWGKTSNFELDARVPLIIASPDHVKSSGTSTQSLAELLDLYPTLADLSGLGEDLTDRLEGVSQAAVLEDPATSVKDFALTQHEHPFYGPVSTREAMGRSIRTDRWRYTEWRSLGNDAIVARELYDHVNDPAETQNRAATDRQVVSRLAERLGQLLGVPDRASGIKP
ncbi:MAG: sulfatase [Planctomycetota bacterium]